ncbi:MAG TPA: MFS transporter [Acidimicrobiales bacterium]|jgi:EmrB/QacA subfamily drug resistance transporter
MSETVSGPGGLSELRSGRQSSDRMVLVLACVAQFMVVLDVSVVNVALPSIGRDLHYSATGLQWVVNAYVLTFAGFLLLGGRAADLFGRRRTYLAGLVLFTFASLVGGFAQDSAWLTTARAVQGVGGALLSPATLTIIVTTFTGARLARALGIWSAVAGAGGAAGSILGGVLTAEASWRWVLFINLPIGIVVLVFALRYLTELRREQRTERLDVAGAVAVTAGLGVLIYAIVGTDTHSWGSATTLGTLGVAVVLLVAFALVERAASAPLVPFGLFRSRSLTGANLVMLLVGAAFFSMWYFLSLYLQNVLGYSALRAGLAFFPMAVAIVIGAQISSRVLPRLGTRPLLTVGTVIVAVGFAWLSRIEPAPDYWGHVFGPGCLISLALGLMFTPLAAAGTAGVAQQEAGLASGVLNTSRQIGGSLGLAVLATVATDRTLGLLHADRRGAAALTSGYGRAFAVAAGLGAVACVLSAVVPNVGRSAAGDAHATEDPRDAAEGAAGTEPAGARGAMIETEQA